MNYIIYKITFPNQKVYIGQTKNYEERKKQHYKKSQEKNPKYPLYRAIKKYGWDNIIWEIIDYCKDQKELNEKEKYWIEYYNSFVGFDNSNGYNATLGGEGHLTTSFNIQDILKISQIFQENETLTAKEIKEKIPNCNIDINYIRSIIRGDKLRGFTHLPKMSEEEKKRKRKIRRCKIVKKRLDRNDL